MPLIPSHRILSVLLLLAACGSTASDNAALVAGVPRIDLGTVRWNDEAMPTGTASFTNLGDTALRVLGASVTGSAMEVVTFVDDPTGWDFDPGETRLVSLTPDLDRADWVTGQWDGTLVLVVAPLTSGGCGGVRPFGTAQQVTLPVQVALDCDVDGDGQDADACQGLDCDDEDRLVHDDATETCDGLDNDCDGEVDEDAAGATWFWADTDGDGWGAVSTSMAACTSPGSGWVEDNSDCDDGDAAVNPDAAEACDGVDNDCDGMADESDDAVGQTEWFRDYDGDGYGNTAWSRVACEAPTGYVSDATDCDDYDATRYPLGAEACDGVDNDCDEVVDEDAMDGFDLSPDADGDGYGDAAASPIRACEATSGWVTDATDCDDAAADVHPGAEDWCAPSADGRDDDCDGSVDEEDGLYSFYSDLDGDGFGTDATEVWACAPPVGTAAESGDCDDREAGVAPDLAERCEDGLDNDCDGSPGACGFLGETSLAGVDLQIVGESAGDGAGRGLVSLGDVDGDGFDDVLVAAPYSDRGGTNAGAAWLVRGVRSADVPLTLDLTAADAVLVGDTSDLLGQSVAGGGDVNGDGTGDWLVGAPYHTSSVSEEGAVFIVSGAKRGDLSTADAVATLVGAAEHEELATAAHGGDIDGDGFSDVMAGAPAHHEEALSAATGAAYVFFGRAGSTFTGTLSASGADIVMLGSDEGDGYGTSLAGAGDVNGDGLDDLLVSAPETVGAGTGQVCLYYTFSRVGSPIDLSLGTADFCLAEDSAGYNLGQGPLVLADLDRDGLADVVATDTGYTGTGGRSGAVFVEWGREALGGSLPLLEADRILQGTSANDEAGSGVAVVGDFAGDGTFDLLVGTPGDDGGGTDAGAAVVVAGDGTGPAELALAPSRFGGATSGDQAGAAVAGPLDFDGDGWPDLLVGAPGLDAGGSASGGAYLVLGTGW